MENKKKKKSAPAPKKEEVVAEILQVEKSTPDIMEMEVACSIELIPVPQEASNSDVISEDQIQDIEVAKKMLKIFQSANDRGLEFDLSFKTVKRLMSYKKCYYTGVPFKEDGVFARSFDRIDSAKGYVEGNVVACTVDINQKKSNLSLSEITILYKKLVLNEK